MFTHCQKMTSDMPSFVKEIVAVSVGMRSLESMHVSNAYFQCIEDESMNFSKDGSELVCGIMSS